MLSPQQRTLVEEAFGFSIRNQTAVGGGCISNSVRLETSSGYLFCKYGPEPSWLTFEAEIDGLQALRQACDVLRIPDIAGRHVFHDDFGVLLLEWIDTAAPSRESWKRLGAGLAELHRSTAENFGYDRDNFIGASSQVNGWSTEWSGFFLDRRLRPQFEQARTNGYLESDLVAALEDLEHASRRILTRTIKPALLHGDLWSGNVLFDTSGRPVLIDPAVYYGDQEADIAMTNLFGGFPGTFHDAWKAELGVEYSTATGGEHARNQLHTLYNLYHQLNHLNLFGRSYLASVRAAVSELLHP